ncbi:MAG: hypothetical protein GC200_07820 [Tepidisphaera sp.]|nr:hypothetical protein [Tepidisphaera sp.]
MSTSHDLALYTKFWNDAWAEGLWAASWQKSLEGLTATHAAWSPPSAPGVTTTRHNIWQHVLHLCFWREDALRRLTDPEKPSKEAVAAGNFPKVSDTSEAAWAATKARFAKSQEAVAAALAKPGTDCSRLIYMLPHDCYHMGQINLIRAMLGLPAIE